MGRYEIAGVDQVTFIDAISGFGGEADVNNLLVSAGIEGKWLTFSLTGGNIQPGYYHLTTLNIESLQSKGCLPENFVLTKGVVADELVSSIAASWAYATPHFDLIYEVDSRACILFCLAAATGN